MLICGAFSDFGLEFIKKVYGDYNMIIAQCSSNPERFSQLGLDKLDTENKIRVVCADFSDNQQTEDFLRKVDEFNCSITDIVHFSCPKFRLKKFSKTQWQEYENMINISFKSAVLVLGHFMPKMEKAGFGNVVIMLSDSIVGAVPKYCTHYVCTKFALLGLVKSLAKEYAGSGVNINGVSPGTTQTKFFSQQPRLFLESAAESSPLGRNLSVSETVGVIKFLLSEDARSINGENITINGGCK